MTVKFLGPITAADGTALATGSSVGGDAPSLIAKNGAGNLTVSSTQAIHGAKSVRLVSTASADTAIFRYTGFTALKMGAHVYIRMDATPATAQGVFQIRNNADVAVCTVTWTTANQLTVEQQSFGLKYTTTTALALNTWHRISVYASANATTGTQGTLKFRTYTGDSTTATNTYDSGAAFDLGTVTLDRVQMGKTSSGGPINGYVSSFRVDDTVTDLLPPETLANTPPTANAGPDQTDVEPWEPVTLTGTDSDPDGTITARSWTQTGGSPTVTITGTGATRTFEAPGTIAGTALTFQYAATDNAGATASDTMTVAVLPVTERAVIGGVEVPMRIRLL